MAKKTIVLIMILGCFFLFTDGAVHAEKAGGWFKYPIPAEPRPMDPQHQYNEKNSNTVSVHIYESLVAVDEKLNILPELATSWEAAADGKSYVFHLRKGVKFHDGVPFDANAVKANFDRFSQQKPNTWMFVDAWFQSIDIIDEHTVRINLKKVYTPFMTEMAQVYMRMLSPKAISTYKLEELGLHPSGTGPWKFKEWISGDRIVLERNDQYWGGKPLLDGIIFKITPDSMARLMGFESGSFDIINEPQYVDIERLEKTGKYITHSQPSSEMFHFAFNCLKAPLDQKEIRLAIIKAVNRELLVKSLLGESVIKADGFGPVWHSDNLINDKIYAYDPNGAKEMLSKLGWKPGPDGILAKEGKRLAFKIMTPVGRYPMDKQMTEVLQAELKKIGVEATPEVVDGAAFIQWNRATCDTRVASPIGMACRTRPLGASMEFALVQHYHSDFKPPLSNVGCFSNKDVDQLLTEASGLVDGKARYEAYKKAQEIIFDEAAVMPVYYYRSYVFSQKYVKNVVPFPPAYSPPIAHITHKSWIDK